MANQDEFQKRVEEAMRHPENMGELSEADSVGTVGNAECGEMLRMWVKFKQEQGKKVIDQATFQSFGCETAIAVASLATKMIQGKTPEEALSMKGEELAGDLGPLPPMKIHCAQLVEGALKSALESRSDSGQAEGAAKPEASSEAHGSSLLQNFSQASKSGGKIRFLERDEEKSASGES